MDRHKRQAELGIQLAEGEKYLTGDYIVDEKQRTIGVTDEGWDDDREGCWASATSPTRRTGN